MLLPASSRCARPNVVAGTLIPWDADDLCVPFILFLSKLSGINMMGSLIREVG